MFCEIWTETQLLQRAAQQPNIAKLHPEPKRLSKWPCYNDISTAKIVRNIYIFCDMLSRNAIVPWSFPKTKNYNKLPRAQTASQIDALRYDFSRRSWSASSRFSDGIWIGVINSEQRRAPHIYIYIYIYIFVFSPRTEKHPKSLFYNTS